VKISPAALFHKLNATMLALLKPLGIWGIGGLALVDSSSVPMPIDALLIDYVAHDHGRFVLYCFMAAVGSGIGSLVWYYIGRAGGELILLKRINRKRYEQIRDRFEKQEFFAIMVPAMMPPPTPVKLFEIAAGVFEMKPLWFFSAICVGKFIRFMIWAIITITYGPALLRTITQGLHRHLGYVLGAGGIVVVLIAVYVIRKLFDRRRGTNFPSEDEEETSD
jgi:membrane protein YqaA with SNARE-associated domain